MFAGRLFFRSFPVPHLAFKRPCHPSIARQVCTDPQVTETVVGRAPLILNVNCDMKVLASPTTRVLPLKCKINIVRTRQCRRVNFQTLQTEAGIPRFVIGNILPSIHTPMNPGRARQGNDEGYAVFHPADWRVQAPNGSRSCDTASSIARPYRRGPVERISETARDYKLDEFRMRPSERHG